MALTETASEFGKGARESLGELSRTAGKRLDKVRDGTGDALHAAASSVRETGRRSSKAINSLAAGTADRLDATASFVEDYSLKRAYASLRRFGQRHPAGTLAATAGLGILTGLALYRATHPLHKSI
jgi:ElaB/YqjD/DUF883 family membrane-anchored ribosome-binding protein